MQTDNKRYVVIGFLLDTTINPCGTPCRSCTFIHQTDNQEEALDLGLKMEREMEDHRGTSYEYDEVQVLDMKEVA